MDANTLREINLILDILEETEMLLSKYYGLCALTFPEDSTLWEDISQEEITHSRFVARMREAVMDNPGLFEMGRLNLSVLKTYRKGLENQFIRLKQGDMPRKNSLYIARDLENSLMEHRFYEVLEGGDEEYQKLKKRIMEETEQHLQKIDDYIKSRL